MLRCLKHLCMGDAKHLEELQAAGAIPHLVGLLKLGSHGGALWPEMRNQCVNWP